MKKLIALFISILILIPVNLHAVSNVNYDIIDMFIDASIDIDGHMKVKELIVLDGSFNGYIRELEYSNDLPYFTGSKDDFEGSSIYNGSNIQLLDAGTIDYKKDADFSIFNNEITRFIEDDGYNGAKGVFEKTNTYNGLSLKMYNETNNSITAFYIEYVIYDVAVLHEDVGEVYFNFIGSTFDDEIEKLRIRLSLPGFTSGDVRVWAHGPLNGEVSIIEDNGVKTGVYAYIEDLSINTPVDIRLTYPKELLTGAKKKTEMNALNYILDIEQTRADEANKERNLAKILVTTAYITSGIYLIGLIGIALFAYKKYDKEHTSSFKGEYYREIIEEYEVPSVEYLMDKKITYNSFSASIMNMIYKKNISVIKDNNKKKEYTFTKENEKGLTEDETKIMDLLFNEIGESNTVTMSQIKTFAKKTSSSGNNEFLNRFNSWKNSAEYKAEKEDFYEKNGTKKILFCLYSILGFFIFYFNVVLGNTVISIIVLTLSIIYFIYILCMSKRTIRGNEHYSKWKAFKKFLEDFGRLDEKDLPEIILWEKYLVYATVLGVADKVSEAMEVKLNSMGTNEQDIFLDTYIYTTISRDLNRTVKTSYNNAVTAVSKAVAAKSSSSSGGGFGGGFSGGGGFGGGGGGGRGF